MWKAGEIPLRCPVDASQEPGRYQILTKIGQGGIGAVYRARDTALKREVAIKRLLPQCEKPEEERNTTEELVREASLLSKLQHPNIVTVYDAGIDEDGGFVVMELIDGETIDETIGRGALTYGDFKGVAEQALEGLIAAQEIDMLHRDLKPSNVMISWLPSGRFELKLLDFGLAKVTQRPSLQTVQHGDAILGSIYFMAPEQFEREPLDGRTDLYSMGCLFYYALAGAYPFDGEHGAEVMTKKLEHQVVPLHERRPDIPPGVCDWVMRLMARGREGRPATAKLALEELDLAVRAAGPASAPQPTPVPVPGPPGPPPGSITTAMVSPGAVLHTTSYYMAPPRGSNKRQTAVAAVATFSILGALAAGGWYLFAHRGDADVPPGRDPVEDGPADGADVGAAPAKPVSLVPLGSVWKYWDRGTPPAEGWQGEGYDSSGWQAGAAPLGYGEANGIRTTISFGDDPGGKHISSFFRHQFEVTTEPEDPLQLAFQVDDGCVIYLNGREIARHAMAGAGPPGDSQVATVIASAAAETVLHTRELDASLLRQGDNVIAARVHQANPSSSDLRFDLKLAIGR